MKLSITFNKGCPDKEYCIIQYNVVKKSLNYGVCDEHPEGDFFCLNIM